MHNRLSSRLLAADPWALGSNPDPTTAYARVYSEVTWPLWPFLSFFLQGDRTRTGETPGHPLQPSQPPPSTLRRRKRGGVGAPGAPGGRQREGGEERGLRLSVPRAWPTQAADSAFSRWAGAGGVRACWEKFCQSDERLREGQSPVASPLPKGLKLTAVRGSSGPGVGTGLELELWKRQEVEGGGGERQGKDKEGEGTFLHSQQRKPVGGNCGPVSRKDRQCAMCTFRDNHTNIK